MPHRTPRKRPIVAIVVGTVVLIPSLGLAVGADDRGSMLAIAATLVSAIAASLMVLALTVAGWRSGDARYTGSLPVETSGLSESLAATFDAEPPAEAFDDAAVI